MVKTRRDEEATKTSATTKTTNRAKAKLVTETQRKTTPPPTGNPTYLEELFKDWLRFSLACAYKASRGAWNSFLTP